jgi:hypothetical protein
MTQICVTGPQCVKVRRGGGSEKKNRMWRATTHIKAAGTCVMEIRSCVGVRTVSHGMVEIKPYRYPNNLNPSYFSYLPAYDDAMDSVFQNGI